MYKAPDRQSNILNSKISLGLLLCFLFQNFIANTQNLTQSPYSYFGVGDLQYYGSVTFGSMGQTSQGMRRGYDLNSLNPASYSALKQTNLEAGALFNYAELSSGQTNLKTSLSGLSYFNLGTTISKKGIGIAFGAAPYSALGYEIVRKTPIQTDTAGIINATTIQKGDGGLNRAYIGVGVKINKYFSAGVNIGYLFGQVNSSILQTVPPEYYMFNWAIDKKDYVNGFLVEYGVQAHFDSVKLSLPRYGNLIDSNGFERKKFFAGKKSPISINAGLTFNLESAIDGTQRYSFRTLSRGGVDYSKDSIKTEDNKNGEIVIPMSIKYGLAFTNNTNWTLAVDLGTTAWSKYTAFGENRGLQNTWFIAAGASFLPDMKEDSRNYFKRLEYRIGYRTEQSNILLNNQSVNINSISCGIGIPIAERDRYRKFSRVNIGFDYLTRGANTSLINETYYKFTVGIVFSDRWFIKYKYD